jgi:hypothetical protein
VGIGIATVRRIGVTAVLAVLGLLAPVVMVGGASAAAVDPIVNVAPPVVTGTAQVGERVRTSSGDWTPAGLTFTYRWLRDGSPIAGATSASYKVRLEDLGTTLSAEVTATDATDQTGTATSDPTGVVRRGVLEVVDRPSISGVTRYDHRLTADPGTWAPKVKDFRFRWLRSGEAIPGATKATYLLAPEDVGERVTVEVTARRDGYQRGTARAKRTKAIDHRVPLRRMVSYHVETRGKITADLATFKRLAQETYDDARGWRGAGMGFKRVAKGGAFTLVLAQASWVPRFSSVCSAEWSCRVGRFVIINQTRWLHASPAWNAAGRSLRDYRNMVVNHETGHWLGHGHLGCPGPGRLAPVMMQQSKGTDGCKLNPWPLRSELWAHPSGKLAELPPGADARVWVD